MKIIPIGLRQANEFTAANHRHHGATVGHKFSIGLTDEGKLVGCAIVGRPVARASDDGFTAEVARLTTDGSKNACSMLYGACARIAKAMGYDKIQTYILETESGTSLRASGWKFEATTKGRPWKVTGQIRNNNFPLCHKQRWSRKL